MHSRVRRLAQIRNSFGTISHRSMASYSPSNAKVTSVEPMPPNEARWIKLEKIIYQDPTGKTRKWESAARQTRPKNGDCDAVGVVAVLNDPRTNSGPSLLLQKQFRPPLNRVTIEVPSGLIDEGEDAATTAVRELKEETGYVGTVPADAKASEGFIMYNDPGMCNTNTKMIFLEVDMDDPRNQDPRPELEENEYIECFTVPLDDLWHELEKLDADGYAIDARVGTLAQGMEMAKRWKGTILKSSR